jgi:hypothetical protein
VLSLGLAGKPKPRVLCLDGKGEVLISRSVEHAFTPVCQRLATLKELRDVGSVLYANTSS